MRAGLWHLAHCCCYVKAFPTVSTLLARPAEAGAANAAADVLFSPLKLVSLHLYARGEAFILWQNSCVQCAYLIVQNILG